MREDGNGAGEVEEGQVNAFGLIPAHEQASVTVHPAMCAFDDPTSGLFAQLFLGLFLSSTPQMELPIVSANNLLGARGLVAGIQA